MGERWTAWANEPWRAAAVAAAARQEAAESRQEEAAAVPWPFEESERQCSGRSAGEDLRTESARRCEIFSSWRCTQIPDMSGHAVMVGDASRAASGALPSILATSK